MDLTKDIFEVGQKILDHSAEKFHDDVKKMADQMCITLEYAAAILYLRTRSWNKPEYEEKLLELCKQGIPLPDGISSGEWAEQIDRENSRLVIRIDLE